MNTRKMFVRSDAGMFLDRIIGTGGNILNLENPVNPVSDRKEK